MSIESTAIIIPTIDETLQEVANAQDNAVALRNGFAIHFEKLHVLANQAKAVGESQPKKAKELRLAIRAVRCAADKTREELKADSLRYGKAVQGVYNVLEYQAVPMEEALEKIEKAEELREQARKKALQDMRNEELRPYLDPTHMSLGEMSEDYYRNLFESAKKAHEEKIVEAERQRVAEIERQQREAAERARLEQVRVEEAAKLKAENERLAAEASKLRAEQEAKDRAAEVERVKIESEREAERKKLQEERSKREAAEAQAKRMRDEADAKSRAEQEAVKKASRAPEKEKFIRFAAEIRALKIPEAKSQEGQALAVSLLSQIEKFSKWVEAEAAKL